MLLITGSKMLSITVLTVFSLVCFSHKFFVCITHCPAIQKSKPAVKFKVPNLKRLQFSFSDKRRIYKMQIIKIMRNRVFSEVDLFDNQIQQIQDMTIFSCMNPLCSELQNCKHSHNPFFKMLLFSDNNSHKTHLIIFAKILYQHKCNPQDCTIE